MIELLQAPTVEREGDVQFLTLWACEMFDQEYSFRVLLERLGDAFSERAPVILSLPPEVPGEDFVDGEMTWGRWTIPLYYERSLGYLDFRTDSMGLAEALMSAVRASCTWPGEERHLTSR